MLSKEDNELLTRVGPGTLMGDLMRQYWLPFLYTWELEPDGPPLRVRLLGEDLIAFRDTNGRIGLLAENCPHRGASLFFGRNEECGLRCVYHGWKWDVEGSCLDMPNEPPESNPSAPLRAGFKHKVKATAYPAREWGGVIWAYLGPRREPPGLPAFEWTLVPENQRGFVFKAVRECNWMQALEGDIDTSHLYFLHGRLRPEDPPAYGTYHKDKAPRLEIQETAGGLLYGSRREEDEGNYYWRSTQFLMPFYTLFPASPDDTVPCDIWVPIDDENTLTWQLKWHPSKALADADLGPGLGPFLPPSGQAYGAWRTVANSSDDFLIDREVQRTKTFTGIPGTAPAQDTAVTVSMGPMVDRNKEHLGTSDATIIQTRRRLIHAAKALREQGVTPPGVATPEAYLVRSLSIVLPKHVDFLEATRDWHLGRGAVTLPEAQTTPT